MQVVEVMKKAPSDLQLNVRFEIDPYFVAAEVVERARHSMWGHRLLGDPKSIFPSEGSIRPELHELNLASRYW